MGRHPPSGKGAPVSGQLRRSIEGEYEETRDSEGAQWPFYSYRDHPQ